MDIFRVYFSREYIVLYVRLFIKHPPGLYLFSGGCLRIFTITNVPITRAFQRNVFHVITSPDLFKLESEWGIFKRK